MMKGYHYTESGLRNVWLANGFEVRQTRYGEGVAIHDVFGLHQAIGKALARKAALTGAELRFLRKEMNLSQAGLGELVGVTDQAIAKWEKTGKTPKTADRMIRLIYLEHVGGNVQIRNTIEGIAHTDMAEQNEIIVEEDADGWKLAA